MAEDVKSPSQAADPAGTPAPVSTHIDDVDSDTLATMSPDELAKLDTSDRPEPAPEPAPAVEDTPEPAIKADEKTEVPPEPPEQPVSPESAEGEPEPTADPWEDRYKQLQADYTRKAQELADAKRTLEESKEKSEVDTFEQRRKTAEELEELKFQDPSAYADYKIQEHRVLELQKKIEERQQAELVSEQNLIAGNFLIDKFEEQTGLKVDRNKEHWQQDPAVQEKMRDFNAEFVIDRLNTFFMQNKMGGASEKGLFTQDQLNLAYNAVFADQLNQKRVEATRAQVVNDAVNADQQASVFDKKPGQVSADLEIPADELTEEQIANLTPDQVREYLLKEGENLGFEGS